MHRRRRAFTLVELMAVVLLTALLATAVSLSLVHSRRIVQLQEVLDQLAFQDRLMRQQARQANRPARLLFQLDQDRVARVDSADPQVSGSCVQLPRGYRIDRLRLPGGEASMGEIALPCSANGHTPTYALRISAPQGQRQWIVVAGLTGQVQKEMDENTIHQLFAALGAARPDAD